MSRWTPSSVIAKSCALPALNEPLGFMTRSMARPRDVEGESRQKGAICEEAKQQRSEARRGVKLRESRGAGKLGAETLESLAGGSWHGCVAPERLTPAAPLPPVRAAAQDSGTHYGLGVAGCHYTNPEDEYQGHDQIGLTFHESGLLLISSVAFA